LTLIAFWSFAAAGLRVVDFLIALSLELPRALYDTVAMTGFSLITGVIAWWLNRQLGSSTASATVLAAFSAVVFVFTAADLAIGAALAPRFAATPPAAIYGNNLAQQITSTFDVTIVALSLTVLVALLSTGPLSGYLLRRAAEPPVKAPVPSAPVTTPVVAPKIVRLKDDSTTVLPAPATTELPAPTATLRIQRRDPAPPTTRIPPPDEPQTTRGRFRS
jgi:hypothetical protein